MTSGEAEPIRVRLTLQGIVQGVGFRPHVHALAAEHGVAGFVTNTAAGVVVEAEGRRAVIDAFAAAVVERAPPLAVVESCSTEALPVTGDSTFEIRASVGGAAATLVSPDVATCTDCLRELADPGDRRFRYPFTNCTNCGPRYTIVTAIPYDRPNTTMAAFAMCAACRREYEDPGDRRFHAQPLCCPDCGPRLDASIDDIAVALRSGEIVAVKGLGGYHLAVVASSEAAVARLRARKHRDDKPFAVTAADVEAVSALCVVDEAAEELLSSAARPIVLLPRRDGAAVASSVAPKMRELGVMLPYTPLHHLLLTAVGEPIVLTSGNVSDEPIAYRDDDAGRRLRPIADRLLTHDRAIHIRVEDSVARVVDSAPYLLRRSRGYAPAPIAVPWESPQAVLACGAELKSTIALAAGRRVFVSHHLGDLKNFAAYQSFVEAIGHLGRLFAITPQVVAHDLHPDYLSTTHALELADAMNLPAVGVQHHHAHVASCLADNGRQDRVIGVAFDGTGYGTDATIWGGEFLVADLAGFERCAWLAPVALPGGDAATDEPWRIAASYLDVLGEAGAAPEELTDAAGGRWDDVLAIARAGVNSPLTSSVGRLFDAVAAVIGLRHHVTYEGQAAIELEAAVDPTELGVYPVTADGQTLGGAELVAAALVDHRAGVAPGVIAARFHRGLAQGVVAMCTQIGRQRGLATVALSGGVFANVCLLGLVTRGLGDAGFEVLRHRRVPCNDGGISLGQAVVASAQLRSGGHAPNRQPTPAG
ncbi:MAG: carbamoyltransferase HypF [Actinomycetota bacterium]|nr:carbamoyltransferase HypF [Actinomycetota bacterium]